jgi:hypothetical protein
MSWFETGALNLNPKNRRADLDRGEAIPCTWAKPPASGPIFQSVTPCEEKGSQAGKGKGFPAVKCPQFHEAGSNSELSPIHGKNDARHIPGSIRG